MHRLTREQLDKLTPEKRAKAEALMAKHRTPKARASEEAARVDYDRQMRETGTIETAPSRADEALARLGGSLRECRTALGLSLDDVARDSGVERSALAKLERGSNPNPTVGTLRRVASALGGRIRLEFEPTAPADAH